ncbi:MAG: LarC family nickel insertion protein, partial [Actinomycetota bacterium]|nr:LarC family nickel insertion protein [Actinomycetota bacterium]
MTTIAYLDPVGGVSGDMLLAALLDAGADRAVVDRTIEALGVEGVAVTIERVERGGLRATRVLVAVSERAEARSAS